MSRLNSKLRRRAVALASVPPLVVVATGHPVGADQAPQPGSGVTVDAHAQLLNSLSATLGDVPDSKDLSVPVLWSGVLATPAGKPIAGHVVAEVRPQHLGTDARTQKVMAHTDVDATGAFVLRTEYTPEIASYADAQGNVTVMLVANSAVGMTFAVDTLRFENGAWRSDPNVAPDDAQPVAALSARVASVAHTAASKSAPDPVDTLHPRVLTVRPTPAGVEAKGLGGDVSAEASPKHAPPGYCGYDGNKWDLGSQYTGNAVEINIASGKWDVDWNYVNTASTNWGVAFGLTGGSTLSGNGSVSFEQYRSVGAGSTVSKQGHNWAKLQVEWWKYEFSCWNGDPRNSHYYTMVEDEPDSWLGGSFVETNGSIVGCGTRYRSFVPPRGHFDRKQGSKTTVGATMKIEGKYEPYVSTSFGVSLGAQSGNDVSENWKNTHSDANQTLCGVSGPIISDTRVVAMK